jgi:copper chaperone CopZ
MQFDYFNWAAGRLCVWRHRRWISPYLDGELDPRTEAEMRDHLGRCQSCRAEYDRQVFASQLASTLPMPERAPASVGLGLESRVAVARPRAEMSLRRPLAVAVAVTLGLLAIGLYYRLNQPAPRYEQSSTNVAIERIALKVTQGGCDNTGFCCLVCEKRLARAIQSIPGVHDCELHQGQKEIVVACEKEKVTFEDIEKATEKAGFKVAMLRYETK